MSLVAESFANLFSSSLSIPLGLDDIEGVDIGVGGFLNDPHLRSLSKELLQDDLGDSFESDNVASVTSVTSVTKGVSHDFINRKVGFDFVSVKKRIQIQVVKPKLFIQNVVSCVQIPRKLDKTFILSQSGGRTYAKKGFAALIHKRPKTTALIFTTGKLVVTGAKSESESRTEADAHITMLEDIYNRNDRDDNDNSGFTGFNFKVHNVVASGTTSYPISLSKLHFNHKMDCQYEPEDFPGVIYRMTKLNITLLIFASGKLVITGGKSVADVEESFRLIVEILNNYKHEYKKNKK
jgi:transcription initiation factor TFIID TATA-box-binding protein